MEVGVEYGCRVFSSVAPVLKVERMSQVDVVLLEMRDHAYHPHQGFCPELTALQCIHQSDRLDLEGELQRHVLSVTHDALELAFSNGVSAVHLVCPFLHLFWTLASSMDDLDLREFVEH